MANAFDLTVHHRNKKGAIDRTSPYRMYIKDGFTKFERPPGSGFFYSANGELLSSPAKAEEKPLPEAVKEEIVANKPEVKAKGKMADTSDSIESVLQKAQK